MARAAIRPDYVAALANYKHRKAVSLLTLIRHPATPINASLASASSLESFKLRARGEESARLRALTFALTKLQQFKVIVTQQVLLDAVTLEAAKGAVQEASAAVPSLNSAPASYRGITASALNKSLKKRFNSYYTKRFLASRQYARAPENSTKQTHGVVRSGSSPRLLNPRAFPARQRSQEAKRVALRRRFTKTAAL